MRPDALDKLQRERSSSQYQRSICRKKDIWAYLTFGKNVSNFALQRGQKTMVQYAMHPVHREYPAFVDFFSPCKDPTVWIFKELCPQALVQSQFFHVCPLPTNNTWAQPLFRTEDSLPFDFLRAVYPPLLAEDKRRGKKKSRKNERDYVHICRVMAVWSWKP